MCVSTTDWLIEIMENYKVSVHSSPLTAFNPAPFPLISHLLSSSLSSYLLTYHFSFPVASTFISSYFMHYRLFRKNLRSPHLTFPTLTSTCNYPCSVTFRLYPNPPGLRVHRPIRHHRRVAVDRSDDAKARGLERSRRLHENPATDLED